jgi:hypothetical protein
MDSESWKPNNSPPTLITGIMNSLEADVMRLVDAKSFAEPEIYNFVLTYNHSSYKTFLG